MRIYSLKVCAIKSETDDTATICFKQPALKKIKYLAGQYLTLIFRINGRRYIRPYSFSSAPGVDNFLEITIKRVPGGIVSNHIIDQLKADDIVEAMEPMGDFVLSENSLTDESHLVLWGAGSGITPLMSLAKYALHNNLGGHVTLVYGNRNNERVIFKDKIIELQQQFSNKFSALHFYTKPTALKDDPFVIQGRIDPDKAFAVMKSGDNIQNSVHYICGPFGLKESVRAVLTNLQVPALNINSEDFEVKRDLSDFDDITTRVISLNKGGVVTDIEVAKGKSILEAALDANVELEYSCQTGNCLVCKGRLMNGNIRMIGVDTMPEGLSDGEYLLCSSFPVTDDVQIEVD